MAEEKLEKSVEEEPGETPVDQTSGKEADQKVDSVRADAVDVHPPTPVERVMYRGIWAVALGAAKVWVRLRMVGRDKIPRDRPFVLAPVHRSNIDFLMVAFLTSRRMRFMGKASLWKNSLFGRFLTMLGAFPVHRGTADRASLRTCLQVIGQGEPLVMFPEGTRRDGTVVEDVFDGPAYVAARAGVPLIPVGIGGSDRAMPIGSRWIHPHKITLVVGDPIEPPDPGGGRVPRRVVRELTEQLQAAVQDVYDEARKPA